MHLVRGLSYFLTKQSGNLKDNSLTEDLNNESSHMIKSNHSEDNTKQQFVDEKEEDYALKALSELLHSLKPDDLPRQSVFQFSRPKLTQLEKEEEMRKMKQEFNLFWEVRLFMKVMFQFFKVSFFYSLFPFKDRLTNHSSSNISLVVMVYYFRMNERLIQLQFCGKVTNFLFLAFPVNF